MSSDDPIKTEISNKFFDPVINATDFDELRAWLRQQPTDEIELFLHTHKFKSFRDRQTVLVQELERRRQGDERRSKWADWGYKIVAAVIVAAIAAIITAAFQ